MGAESRIFENWLRQMQFFKRQEKILLISVGEKIF